VVEPEADIYDISAQGYSFPSIHSCNAVTVFCISLIRRDGFLSICIKLNKSANYKGVTNRGIIDILGGDGRHKEDNFLERLSW
jgi:hypothetical protein